MSQSFQLEEIKIENAKHRKIAATKLGQIWLFFLVYDSGEIKYWISVSKNETIQKEVIRMVK